MPHAHSSLLLSWICGLFLLAGCGGESSSPDLGDWTLKTDGLSLTEDLLVSEAEAFYVGSIAGRRVSSPGPGMDVASDGRILVADPDAHHLKILRPDGSLLDTLGRQGVGPGEFRRLQSVQVARGDSIYAYEGRRVTVFAPTPPHDVARTFTLQTERIPPFQVLMTERGGIALYGTPLVAGRAREKEGVRAPWRWIDAMGVPIDTVFTARLQRLVSVRRGDRRFSLYPVPWEPGMQVALGPNGRAYVTRSDSLHVTAYRRDGGSKVMATVPAEPVAVSETERDSILNGIEEETMRNAVASPLPDAKAPVMDLVVADNERLWIERPSDGSHRNTVPWWVLDPETKTVHEVRLPREVNLEVVQNGKAYGSTTTEAGAPAVVRYHVHPRE